MQYLECTMLRPGFTTEYIGFTEDEVKKLSQKHGMDFDEMKQWYDGYYLSEIDIYNPNSVVQACIDGSCENYWTQTETFEALKEYILMDFDGLQDAVIRLFAGETVYVEIDGFSNDFLNIKDKDDVLTLLVHLGYLNYNQRDKTVVIPNKEVMDSFRTALRTSPWTEVKRALE